MCRPSTQNDLIEGDETQPSLASTFWKLRAIALIACCDEALFFFARQIIDSDCFHLSRKMSMTQDAMIAFAIPLTSCFVSGCMRWPSAIKLKMISID